MRLNKLLSVLFVLRTKIIEKVSGEKFNEYSKKFFKDLGMNETSFVEKYMSVIQAKSL